MGHGKSSAVATAARAGAAVRRGVGPTDDGRISLESLVADPYPHYRELRDAGVVWVEALERWMVTRWDDVGAVEVAREAFSATEPDSLLTRTIGHQMLREDGEAHKRLRSAAAGPLQRPAIEAREPVLRRIAEELIDGFVDRGCVDLIAEFAVPFAARCLIEVLGVDASPRDIARWSTAIMNGAGNYADDPAVWSASLATVAEIDAVVDAALSGGGPPPGSIIAAMAAKEGQGRALSREEIYANTKVMVGGGYNEPRDAVGTAVMYLLSHPDQLADVLADPSLWPRVVEEAVRMVAPIGVVPRVAKRPIRLADTDLEPGARLLVNFAAANRDERQWERPDDFDVHRPKARNVAFGVGHHFCLGVWMARLQVGAVSLPALFDRLPGLQLDLDRPPVVRGWVFRGPTELWVRW
ncbi:MAG: cytochrome P450 [Actinobacteria bacterium]|nr:cytochrome P450 [Actinomycetota bacterium]